MIELTPDQQEVLEQALTASRVADQEAEIAKNWISGLLIMVVGYTGEFRIDTEAKPWTVVEKGDT